MNLIKELKNLPFLKGPKNKWEMFNVADAHAARVKRLPDACFNAFVSELGLPASQFYEDTEGHNLVLWHATTREKGDKILEYGFFHHGGVFMALNFGASFCMADGVPKDHPVERAILVSIIDTDEFIEGLHFEKGKHAVRFMMKLPPDIIEYYITEDSIEFVGEAECKLYKPFPRANFMKNEGIWTVPTQNPAYFPGGDKYYTAEEWLELFMRFYFSRNPEVTALELFNAVYCNVSPIEAFQYPDLIGYVADYCHCERKQGEDIILALRENFC